MARNKTIHSHHLLPSWSYSAMDDEDDWEVVLAGGHFQSVECSPVDERGAHGNGMDEEREEMRISGRVNEWSGGLQVEQ